MATQPTLPNAPDQPAQIERDDGSWFELYPGTLSKRVAISSSEWAFILGQLISNEKGILTYLESGDYIQLSQDIDVTDIDLVDFPAEVIGRDNTWLASIYIDDVLFADRTLKEYKEVDWSDFRVPVSHLSGTVNVKVRLTQVGP